MDQIIFHKRQKKSNGMQLDYNFVSSPLSGNPSTVVFAEGENWC